VARLEIEIGEAQVDELGGPKAVAVREEHEAVVTLAVSPLLRRLEQSLDLGLGQLAPTLGTRFGMFSGHPQLTTFTTWKVMAIPTSDRNSVAYAGQSMGLGRRRGQAPAPGPRWVTRWR
jgi:hypothetical protein